MATPMFDHSLALEWVTLLGPDVQEIIRPKDPGSVTRVPAGMSDPQGRDPSVRRPYRLAGSLRPLAYQGR